MEPVRLRQIWVFAAMGAVLWLVVALLLRGFVAWEMTTGPWRGVLYGLGLPAGLLAIWVFGRIGAGKGQMFAAISIGTMVALMLDGLAIGWARWIYGIRARSLHSKPDPPDAGTEHPSSVEGRLLQQPINDATRISSYTDRSPTTHRRFFRHPSFCFARVREAFYRSSHAADRPRSACPTHIPFA